MLLKKGRKLTIIILWIAAIALLFISLCRSSVAAKSIGESICDAKADHLLAAENYVEAIRLHREYLRKHPASGLAHYHLGFAEGMEGDTKGEIKEYQQAAALGLSSWDFELNMGLALLESGNLEEATNALKRAVRLNPSRSEPHFNLGLVYERRDMLGDAEEEMLAALRLEPEDLEARNMLGVIYAREGRKAEASAQWRDLLHDAPSYDPARQNLAFVGGKPPPGEEVTNSYSKPVTNSCRDR
jgi:Flp pilus assembly protein TadD